MLQFVANFLLFQGSWLALVVGAANSLLWPGALLCLLFLGWELSIANNRRGLLTLLAFGLIGGVLVDGSYATFGIVDYVLPAGPVAPWWIMGLWVIFTLTLTQSMAWMRDRPLLGSCLAGIAAPLSYAAGFKFGAITFPQGFWFSMGIAAVTWIPAIYLMVRLSIWLIPNTNASLQKKPT